MSNDGQLFEGNENTDLTALAFSLDALTYSNGCDEIEINFFDAAVIDEDMPLLPKADFIVLQRTRRSACRLTRQGRLRRRRRHHPRRRKRSPFPPRHPFFLGCLSLT